MDPYFAIIVTISAILTETTLVFGIAQHLHGYRTPKRWLLICAAISIFIAALIIGFMLQFLWLIEQQGHNALIFFPTLFLVEMACLLAVLLAASLGALGVLVLVRWLNHRDDPRRVKT